MIWIALPLALACVAALVWFIITGGYINRVTKGHPIPDRPGHAVVLIDLQSCFWTDATYSAAQRKRVEAGVAQLVTSARDNGDPVIALRQEWSHPSTRLMSRLFMGGTALAGGTGTEMAQPFASLADHQIIKRVQDGFETGALDRLLADLNISRLTLAGLDGLYCVNKTAQAALNRGYDVTLCDAATATTDPAKFAKVKSNLSNLGVRVVADAP